MSIVKHLQHCLEVVNSILKVAPEYFVELYQRVPGDVILLPLLLPVVLGIIQHSAFLLHFFITFLVIQSLSDPDQIPASQQVKICFSMLGLNPKFTF